MKLGIQTTTQRGLPIVEFTDRCGVRCSLQASNLADSDVPGMCAVWLGPERGEVVKRIHLDRQQVQGLIDALRCWLDTGKFE